MFYFILCYSIARAQTTITGSSLCSRAHARDQLIATMSAKQTNGILKRVVRSLKSKPSAFLRIFLRAILMIWLFRAWLHGKARTSNPSRTPIKLIEKLPWATKNV